MIIRKLNEFDYENFLELIKDFRDTMFSEIKFKEILNNIDSYSDIWVIELDKKLIATGKIIYETKFIFNICKCAHIEDVCTKKEYRGKGYGKKLIDFLVEQAKENKCYKINLVCNAQTVEFYKKSFFEDRGVHMSYLIL